MIVGGLPEAVRDYAKRKDWVSLNEIFNSLLSGYKDDIEKYTQRCRTACYSLPGRMIYGTAR